MHKRGRALGAVLAIAAGLAFGAPGSAPAQESPQVLMVDNEPDLTRWHYDPADITVPAGTTVVWLNKGKEEHTVTADDRSFDSGLKKTGGTFSRAFPRPGKYSYYCEPHPWMKGTVQVVAAGPTATAASAAPAVTTAPTTATTAAAAVPGQPAPPPAPEETAPVAGDRPDDTSAPGPEASEQDGSSDEDAAAPAAESDGSGGNLAGTLAVVLLPTLGALALGAKLRQAKS